ncbi:glycosyltransferase [Clostridium butanoliproducens]|uniref:glycosyltransferase n=1 Tax=Clostridium butanoliproducens TaxID=2991837 RepID=UPI0024BB8B42|nr:glycosyltransferase [Clostridium butanoliproducens]
MFKIKVLHIISGNDNGGGANHILNICSSENKYFENVLGCLGEGFLYNRVKNTNIPHVFFKKHIINKEIVDFVNSNEIEIVNFHGAQPFLIHFFIKKKLKAVTAATIHSDYRYDFLNNKIKYYIYTPLSVLGLKSFNNYICVSQNLLKLLDKKGFTGRKTVVNNGIDIKKLSSKEDKTILRQKLNITNDNFIFGVVGRFHPVKNYINIIKAFGKFSNENTCSRLILMGDGPLKEDIENTIKELNLEDKVILTGFIDNVTDYLSICNCSIIASYSEGGAPPLAMLESAIVKTPIISTKVGDLENIINPSNGIIINSQNEKDIYIAMQECYDKKAYLQSMGENIYNLVLEKFTMEKFWNNYYNFYKSIIDNK